MRDVDERVSAVQGRVRRIQRQRKRATVGALSTLTVLVCAVLVGIPVVTEQTATAPSGSTLFGAASLFGPSAGGYVLVALVAAVLAVLITVFCMMRRRSPAEKGASSDLADTEAPESLSDASISERKSDEN